MKYLIPIALCSYAMANPGLAGGLADPIIPVETVAPPALLQPFDWYAGVNAGVGSGDAEPGVAGISFRSANIDDRSFGAHVGVQRSFGEFTVGTEIDFNQFSDNSSEGGMGVLTQLESLTHLKLRAGRNVGPALIYGTAGVARASLTIEPAGLPLDLTDTGAVYGVGADIMVSSNISVGGEILVHDFEDMDDSGVDVGFTTTMLRMSYHF